MSSSSAEHAGLVAAAAELGTALPDPLAHKLLEYLDLLYRWNASAGLTRVDREDAVRLHLVDSLTALNALHGAMIVADLGTGGGVPGIPIAMVMPETKFFLVETRRRKCNFLRDVVRTLSLANCEIVEADARTLEADFCDTAIARAFMQPQEMLELAAQLASTRVVLMAGPTAESAELDGPSGWRLSEASQFVLPGGGEERQILSYTHESSAG